MDRLFDGIPFFFTDLIARLIPGGLALWSFSTALGCNMFKVVSGSLQGVTGLQDSGLLTIGLIVAIAYVIGLMIDPVTGQIGNWIEHRYPAISARLSAGLLKKAKEGKKTRYTPHVIECLDDDVKNCVSGPLDAGGAAAGRTAAQDISPYPIGTFLFYDWLNIYVPEAGKRAAKFNAEYLMSRAICVIAFFTLIIHAGAWLWYGLDIKFVNGWLIFLSVVAIVVGVVGMINKSEAFEQHVLNQYYVARNFPKWVEKENTQTPDAPD